MGKERRNYQKQTSVKIIPFKKYQGTGNDFVMIDQRQHQHLSRQDTEAIRFLCDRRFGIGGDGLILLQNHADYDFEMIYFNADGNESSMCGNGGRCIVAFAHSVGLAKDKYDFLAIDGAHEARILPNGNVELKMSNVSQVTDDDGAYILDTGSPHYVVFVEDIDDINVAKSGALIRYSENYKEKGINVNFVEHQENKLLVGTYERGVEDETLSCGTGVTACAIAYYLHSQKNKKTDIAIQAKGGELNVRFEPKQNGFENIWLSGAAKEVFQGEIKI